MMETASSVGLEISRCVREQDTDPSAGAPLADLVDRLCNSEARSALDAMALVVVSKTVLESMILAMPCSPEDDADDPRSLLAVVLGFLDKAAAGLEIETGHGIESFTGLVDSIN